MYSLNTYKAKQYLNTIYCHSKNTNLAPALKIKLCGKVTHPTATRINEDPWEQRDYYLYPFMGISLDI